MSEKYERRSRAHGARSGSSRHTGHSHGHRHHHRRGLKHRVKRWWQRHRWVGAALAILLLAAIAGGVLMLNGAKRQDDFQIASSNQVDVGGGYRQIEYQGKTYRYNNRITTILYAGVDSDGALKPTAKYTYAPRADSISLIVLDELHQCMTVIALNRSTVTPIHRYTLNGRDRGLFDDYLCWAYTYGNGGRVSCTNLCDAVSRLLFNIPINGYVISNRASLPLLADAIGPVRVTAPNDDLSAWGVFKGDTVEINASNLETFVRTRDIEVDFSNSGRMERQQAYIEGAMSKLIDLLTNHPASAWETLEKAEDSVQTNITRSRYLDLTKVLKRTGYSQGSYYIPEGENVVGPKFDEFYPDLAALQAKVIEIFYLEQ